MKIANIFSVNKVNAPDEFNVVDSFSKIIEGLPTLIVGYDYVNKHYPDFDITNICLGPNLYWTFKRTERRDKYEEDLNWFIRKAYLDKVKDIIYISVDPIQYKENTIVKILKKIHQIHVKISYLKGDMVFIYGDKFIFGVDLNLLSYMGVNVDKIKNKIRANSYHFLENDSIFIEYKKVIELLDNKVIYIPYLYHLKNEENNTNSLVHIPRKD